MLYKLHQSTRILSKKLNIFSVVLNALAVIGYSRSVVGCYRMSTSKYNNHKTLSGSITMWFLNGAIYNILYIQGTEMFLTITYGHRQWMGAITTVSRHFLMCPKLKVQKVSWNAKPSIFETFGRQKSEEKKT